MTTNNLYNYTILLRSFEDLDDFYDDMETPGGNLYIPNRRVDVALRRPVSRNTEYYLTPEEAQQVSQDPRVLYVRITNDPHEVDHIGTAPHPEEWVNWTSASDYFTKRKRTALVETYPAAETNGITNWGLLRTAEVENRDMWESGPRTETPTNATKWFNAHAILNSKFGGFNVDLVVWDGILDPSHPDFARNPDGTGGSRVVQRDWFSRNVQCGYPASTYSYPYVRHSFRNAQGVPITADLINSAGGQHGIHVGSTAAGNRHGFAREATIYNIGFLGGEGFVWKQSRDLLYDWHINVKPAEGNNKLTVINHSAGSNRTVNYGDIDHFVVNNVTINSPSGTGTWSQADFTQARCIQLGISYTNQVTATGINFVVADPSRQADIEDMIQAGVYFITAGGNSQNTIQSWDSDNRMVFKQPVFIGGFPYFFGPLYYNRGSFTSENTIIVSNMDTTGQPRLHVSSARGAGITVSAPGTDIWAASQCEADPSYAPAKFLKDYRASKNSHTLRPETGTSMASPHVAGMVALILNEDPGLTPAQVKAKIIADSATGVYLNDGVALTNPLAFGHHDRILTSSNIISSEFTPDNELFRTHVTASGVKTQLPQARSFSMRFNNNPTNAGFRYRVALKDRPDINIEIEVSNDDTDFPSITYPATSTHGTPFSWSISGGLPGDTWFVWTKGAFRVRLPATGVYSGADALDGTGAYTGSGADWSTVTGGAANKGAITITFYFSSGPVTSVNHTVS